MIDPTLTPLAEVIRRLLPENLSTEDALGVMELMQNGKVRLPNGLIINGEEAGSFFLGREDLAEILAPIARISDPIWLKTAYDVRERFYEGKKHKIILRLKQLLENAGVVFEFQFLF